MEQDERFEQLCLKERLEPKSFVEYVERAARVKRLTGVSLGYESLRRYIRLKAKLAAGTLRGVKSAVCFILRLANRPMPEEQAARLDDMIDGLECAKAQPEKVRGAPSAEQVGNLVRAAYEELGAEHSLALIVGHGCATRANELEALDNEDYDSRNEVLWVNRKGRRFTKVRKGRQVERIVTTPEAAQVLEKLSTRGEGKMFPNVKAAVLSQFVNFASQTKTLFRLLKKQIFWQIEIFVCDEPLRGPSGIVVCGPLEAISSVSICRETI